MNRAILYFLLALALVFTVWKGVVPAWRTVHSDFANYYVSAKLVMNQTSLDSLYDNEWFQRKIDEEGIEMKGKFSPFPPITAWLMIPLTPFGPLTAQRIFTIINILLMIPGVLLLKLITRWPAPECLLLVLGAGLGLVNNIAFGQVYWMMTLAVLYALTLQKEGHSIPAGIILGVATMVKYFPVVFIGGFVLSAILRRPATMVGHRRLLVSFLTTALVLAGMQFAFFGSDVMREFFEASFFPHLDGRLNGQVPYSVPFQSWNSFLRNLMVADPEFNPHPFLDWAFGRLFVQATLAGIVGISVLVAVYRLRKDHELFEPACLSLLALGALVLLPASATYHFNLLLVPLALIIGAGVQGRWIKAVIVLYALIGLIPYGAAFRLADQWGLVFAYPRLWLITLTFFIVIFGLAKRPARTD